MKRPTHRLRSSWASLVAVLALSLVLVPSTAMAAGPGSAEVSIEVLSNRADLISGGDALVEILLNEGTDPARLRVTVNGNDVTTAFAVRDDGRIVGLVDGLALGDNELVAAIRPSAQSSAPPGASSASITITNHSSSGPVFSGPHLQPWVCTTEANGLGPAVDAECNAPTRVDWFYRSTTSAALQPYDPENPPADVAMTTTDQGETVPFIVRRERGTMNRSIYDIAVLSDPAQPWEPWAPQSGWNGKVVWAFGPSSGTQHVQGSPQQVLNATRLGAGFMVATSSLNVHGTNLNTVVSAESVMMVKEHIIENYGEIRYVIGQGGSGGAIGQQLVGNTYPGLIDGLIPALSYPDTWTTGMEVSDCSALVETIGRLGGNAEWSPAQRIAIYGHSSTITCTLFPALFGAGADPTVGCNLPQELIYHPENNPDGVRCTASDYMVNVWGIDPDTGYARVAGSTIGIEWGLEALQQGVISPEQFVALNEAFASLGQEPGVRRPSDPGATAIAYRTGQVNDGASLDQVPIIDVRQAGNHEFHTNYHTWAMRDRLIETHGHADNHVIFWSSGAIPAGVAEEVFQLMDQWLAAIEADTSGDALDVQVLRNRPAGAVDTCFIGGVRSTDYEQCLVDAPYFGAPRTAAGLGGAHDNLECQTKPLDRDDYPGVTFTDDQWDRLHAAFPTGVCDPTLPAVDETRSIPWLSFADGPGGEPLGDPPVSRAGCPGQAQGRGNAATNACPGRP